MEFAARQAVCGCYSGCAMRFHCSTGRRWITARWHLGPSASLFTVFFVVVGGRASRGDGCCCCCGGGGRLLLGRSQTDEWTDGEWEGGGRAGRVEYYGEGGHWFPAVSDSAVSRARARPPCGMNIVLAAKQTVANLYWCRSSRKTCPARPGWPVVGRIVLWSGGCCPTVHLGVALAGERCARHSAGRPAVWSSGDDDDYVQYTGESLASRARLLQLMTV